MEQVGEARKLHEANGREWTVIEAGVNGTACLFFECNETVRRVRTYPAGWRELSDDQLIALSWMR
jgi:hypothetical protein